MSQKLLAMAAVLLPLAVQAADMPREGTADCTTNFVVTQPRSMKVGDRLFISNDISGVRTSTGGGAMFDDWSVRCINLIEFAGGHATGSGFCTTIDPDGDQIVEHFEATAGSTNPTTIDGGTGKFAGITGAGEWTYQGVKSPEGQELFVVHTKLHWKLP